jgi:hypothetical protein
MNTLIQLQKATLEARARTGDKHIATQAEAGLIDVVRSVPPASGKGKYAVTVLSAGLTAVQAVAYLGAMK